MSNELELAGIYSLDKISDEQLIQFDCGKLSLNEWLKQKARSNEVSGGSRTYVLLTLTGKVAGFYCLSNFCLAHDGIRAMIRRNMPNPIPAILLGRLAISKDYQGRWTASPVLEDKVLQA